MAQLPAAFTDTAFLTPEERAQLEKIRREREIADAMRTRGLQPIGAKPPGVRINPLELLAQQAQVYFGNRQLEQADTSAEDLVRKNREGIASAMSELSTSMQPRTISVPDLGLSGMTGSLDEEDMPRRTETIVPSPADKRAAAVQFMSKYDPRAAASMMAAEAFKTPSLKYQDAGSEILALDEAGNIVQRIPKSATPDARLREAGAQERHATPSGSAYLGAQTTMRGQDLTDARTRAEGAANRGVALRGQELVNARAREANLIAAGKSIDDATTALRKEFNTLPEVKNYRNVVPMINSVMRAPDTIAGDIELAYTVGKILDPDSVIREGELKLVGNAATILEKYKGELRALTQGKGRLTPVTREALFTMMEGRTGELKSAHDAARIAYEGVARQRGLPAEQIFIELRHTPRVPTPRPQAVNPQTGQVIEWDGTRWVPVQR